MQHCFDNNERRITENNTKELIRINMPKISVIVPVYKVEAHIRQCVNSILAQTLSDFELILIDDGSPDNSGIICDEYVPKDGRVRVIHKENGGVSSARNVGIEAANGEWLCFIDSDDYIDTNYLADFFYDADSSELIMQGYKRIYRGKVISISCFDSIYSTDTQDILAYSEINHIINSPCFKLFKRNIIQENNIRFDTNISYGEDHLFSLSYVSYISCISFSMGKGYNYVIADSESLTHRKVPYQQMIYYIQCVDQITNQLLKKYDSNILKKAFKTTYIDNIFRTIRFFFSSSHCYPGYYNILDNLGLKKIKLREIGYKRRVILFLINYTPRRFSYCAFTVLKSINLI